MEMTFRIENGMLVTEATPEAEAVGFREGARFVVMQTPTGLKLVSEETAEQIAAARVVMDEDHDVLRRLAQ